jgi:hypothetical protein
MKKTNFSVWKMTFLHFLPEIKEMAVCEATSGILYNCLPKVIIKFQGLESYTTCRFHRYGWPKITPKNSRGKYHTIPHS